MVVFDLFSEFYDFFFSGGNGLFSIGKLKRKTDGVSEWLFI